MADTIRCISQHAEEVIIGSDEEATPTMVPAGDVAHNVDLNNPANRRLLDENLIIEVPEEKPKRRGGQSEGDDQ